MRWNVRSKFPLREAVCRPKHNSTITILTSIYFINKKNRWIHFLQVTLIPINQEKMACCFEYLFYRYLLFCFFSILGFIQLIMTKIIRNSRIGYKYFIIILRLLPILKTDRLEHSRFLISTSFIWMTTNHKSIHPISKIMYIIFNIVLKFCYSSDKNPEVSDRVLCVQADYMLNDCFK